MNNIGNIPLLDQNEDADTESASSTGTMLTTMLLLTAGLIMTSTLIMHQMNREEGITNMPSFSSLSFLNKKKSQNNETAPPFQPTKNASNNTGGLSRLFSSNGKVHWPKLSLQGFGTSAEKDVHFAIINGNKIHLGQQIDGKATLLEIRDRDVLVSYKNEQRVLTIDTSK